MLIFRPMTSAGIEVSTDVQMAAFKQWSERPTMTYSGLAADLCRAYRIINGIDVPDVEHPMHRASDRLVQSLRKAGMVERKGSIWTITDRGQNLRAEMTQ